MGLSFHDEASLVEAISTLQFNAPVDNPNSNLGTGSINQDGSLYIVHDDLKAGSEMFNINRERRDDDSSGSGDIQMIDR